MLQLIAESYDLTPHIFTQVDTRTGKLLIDAILDEAKQKGTGMRTLQDTADIQVPIPVIDAVVVARNLSALKSEREAAKALIRKMAGAGYGPFTHMMNEIAIGYFLIAVYQPNATGRLIVTRQSSGA